MRFGARLITALFVWMVSLPAGAQQDRSEANRLEKLRDQASAKEQALQKEAAQTQNEISKLQGDLIQIGARISQQNVLRTKAEEHLETLHQDEVQKTAALLSDQAAMTKILAALQRSEMSPPPPLAVRPDDTLAAARASMLMGAVVPELRIRADQLQVSLAELQQVRSDIQSGRTQLDTQMRKFNDEQANLQAVLGKRQNLEVQLRGDIGIAAKQAKSLAARAANLRELIRQLEIEAKKSTPSLKPGRNRPNIVLAPSVKPKGQSPAYIPPPWQSSTGRFADSRGQLELPVQGRVVSYFGQAKDPDQIGGLVIQTSRRAQITAPYDGRVAFVGKFRNYGQLLILDVGEGYHLVLSGLAKAYVVKGQSVLAGEPIGKMADRRKPAPKFYLEFRKQGQPFDPVPWLKKAIKAG